MFRFGTSLFVSILCFAGMSTMAQSAGQPTDPQIAHIAYTAGQIDIKAAEQALGKSQNKNVKAFAEEMVRDHEAVNKKALALLDKLSVKPEDNDTSKALADAASKKQEELSLTINVGGATAREITYVKDACFVRLGPRVR